MMRWLVGQGVRPADLQAKLRRVPIHQWQSIDLADVAAAAARHEPRLEFFSNIDLQHSQLEHSLDDALANVRAFRGATAASPGLAISQAKSEPIA